MESSLQNLTEQFISKQEELKKFCLETRSTLNNQIKQQGQLYNLVVDLKTPNTGMTQTAKAETDQRFECKICMERPLNTVLTPCGHTLCFECAKKLRNQKKDCPTCREKISGLQKIFL